MRRANLDIGCEGGAVAALRRADAVLALGALDGGKQGGKRQRSVPNSAFAR